MTCGPGFDYNAGTQGRSQAFEALVRGKLARLSAGVRQAALGAGLWKKVDGQVQAAANTQTQRINHEEFSAFFNNLPDSPEKFVIAHLTDAEQSLFGVQQKVMWLSRVSLDEHKQKHPEVTMADYLMIPEIIRNAAVWGGHQKRRYPLFMSPCFTTMRLLLALMVAPEKCPLFNHGAIG